MRWKLTWFVLSSSFRLLTVLSNSLTFCIINPICPSLFERIERPGREWGISASPMYLGFDLEITCIGMFCHIQTDS